MREFAVHFSIRKGLGPEWTDKTVFIGLDDIHFETSESEIRQLARQDAERSLYHSDDYSVYGKNWIFKTIEEV